MPYQDLILRQFEAALATLRSCVTACPESSWNAPVASLAFCQAAFHAAFFADYYLDWEEGEFREALFHREHPDFFRDYEELENRAQTLLYDRPTLLQYIDHCHQKAVDVINAETEEHLSAPCGFARREMSRAELYVYVIRHLQHHAAQLSLRLRLDHQIEIPWFGRGWPRSRRT